MSWRPGEIHSLTQISLRGPTGYSIRSIIIYDFSTIPYTYRREHPGEEKEFSWLPDGYMDAAGCAFAFALGDTTVSDGNFECLQDIADGGSMSQLTQRCKFVSL